MASSFLPTPMARSPIFPPFSPTKYRREATFDASKVHFTTRFNVLGEEKGKGEDTEESK